MREGHKFNDIIIEDGGITPAYAGRTGMEWQLLPGMRDHPRLCGKDSIYPVHKKEVRGSPPLMREGLLYTSCISLFVGITPAYAGRTLLEHA